MTEKVPSDVEIAQAHKALPITEIAEAAGIPQEALIPFGTNKAKVDINYVKDHGEKAKVILVTAMSPTPAGEGKTTTLIGLADALKLEGKNTFVALREPSQGPVMGIKGGAAGGGYAQIVPMEEINLHFTGDFHALAAANNTLAALIDAHIHNGNALNIDPRQITWRRCLDVNDRSLRHIVTGLGGKAQGTPTETGFDITAASEMMAILCLASDYKDLKERIGHIVVGSTYDGKPVQVSELGVEGALTALLKDAIHPNLVQTLGGVPAFVHGGPFANIAHGCNTLTATKTAMKLGDYVCTEAGFGADLGAEKFFDMKARYGDIKVDAVVLVATIRSLKYNGGVAREDLTKENLEALEAGVVNLERHVENVRKFGVEPVIALNDFVSDTQAERDFMKAWGEKNNVRVLESKVWEKGGEGARELAKAVIEVAESGKSDSHPLYDLEDGIEANIEKIATELYHADNVQYSAKAQKDLAFFKKNGWDKLPVIISKTQYSFTDDGSKLGAPEGHTLHVRELLPKIGAGFIVALTGNVMTLPGLGKTPAALKIDIDDNGTISGLF